MSRKMVCLAAWVRCILGFSICFVNSYGLLLFLDIAFRWFPIVSNGVPMRSGEWRGKGPAPLALLSRRVFDCIDNE
jgi:hypothetical protein